MKEEDETELEQECVEEGHVISANVLLERVLPEEYVAEWTKLLMKEKEEEQLRAFSSVVIFRLRKEWFALSTSVVKTITSMRTIHKIPHKTQGNLLGLTNIRGQLSFSIDIYKLLEVEKCEEIVIQGCYKRMIVLEREGDLYVMPADQVTIVHHVFPEEIKNVPVTVSKSSSNYLKGIFEWEKHQVGLIDEELLLYSFNRSVQ